MNDTIYRQAAIDALWKALFEYEEKTEKQFLESDDLDVDDWIQHRIFVQNMSDIDRRVILNLPSAQPERETGEWIEYIPGHGKCPFCGNQVDLLGGKENNFCGECGAYMRGEEDD